MDHGLGRLFGIVDDRPGAAPPAVRAFEVVLLLVIGVEYWLRAIPKWGQLASHYYVLLALATVVCPLGLTAVGRRPAFAALAASHAFLVWSEFPSTGNHAYLELLLCLLATSLDPSDPGEARLYVRAVRWLGVLIIGYSGIQKFAHGYYRHGEYLAFSLGAPTFQPILRPFLTAEEFWRLTAFTGAVGDGPYQVRSWPFVALANGTWIAEVALAPLLCLPRTRTVAVAGALLLIAAIEVGAREVFFGLVYLDVVLLFAPPPALRATVPVAAGLLAVLTLSRLGAIPAITFY